MGIFSLPFAVLALFSISAFVYLSVNTLSVIFTNKKIKVQRQLLLFPVSTKTADAVIFRELIVKRSGSTGDGSNKVEHFKIFGRADAGRQLAHEVKEYLTHRFLTGLGKLLLKVNFF